MPTLKLNPIKPGKMPSGTDYVKAMQAGVQKTAGLTLKDLEATTRTWTHKPLFDVTITQRASEYSVVAGTDSDIYKWVDAGTKAHDIRPKRSRYLRFNSGYKAKTRVGIIGSQAGGAFGEAVYSKGVRHPGFPGRHFMKTIAKRRQVTLAQEVSQAIAKVNRAKQTL